MTFHHVSVLFMKPILKYIDKLSACSLLVTRNTSLTDSETDSDVVFENRTKSTNGVLRSNGVSKNGPKFSTTRLGRRIKT